MNAEMPDDDSGSPQGRVGRARQDYCAWRSARVLLTLLTADVVQRLRPHRAVGSSYLMLTSLTAAKGGGTNSGRSRAACRRTSSPSCPAVPTVFADNGQATIQLADEGHARLAVAGQRHHADAVPRQVHPHRRAQRAGRRRAVRVRRRRSASRSPRSGTVGFTLVRDPGEAGSAAGRARQTAARCISTIAEVTFYGHDQNGATVTVVGTHRRRLRQLGRLGR